MTSAGGPMPWSRVPWQSASSRAIYENRWMKLREDIALLPDGRTTIYGVVECADAVGVLPFLDRDTVLMVGQYRYVAQDLRPARRPPDRTEFIERRAFLFPEVLEMVERGEIKDSMTVIAVLHAARLRASGAWT